MSQRLIFSFRIKWIVLCSNILVFSYVCIAQQKLTIINATSEKVDISDGLERQKSVWNLSPSSRPDVCNVSVKQGETKKITFYTDLDSISFNVKSGDVYDFIILLNNRDSCYTRISTETPKKLIYRKDCAGCKITQDTIPFYVGKDNRIHIQGKINSSETLDLVLDNGSDRLTLSNSGMKKIKNLKFNGTSEEHGLGGTTNVTYSNNNVFQIEKLIWDSVTVFHNKREPSDGLIGRHLFEDKILEIDYDRKIMIVHDSIGEFKNNYSKLNTKKRLGGFLIETLLINEGKEITGWFSLDLGNTGALNIHNGFAANQGLPGNLKKLSKGKARGVGPNAIAIETVLLPKLKIGGFEFQDVPINLEISGTPNQPEGDPGFLGNDLLKRFNIILDFQKGDVYVKVNSLLNTPYSKRSNNSVLIIIIVSSLVLLSGGLYLFYKRKISPKIYIKGHA